MHLERTGALRLLDVDPELGRRLPEDAFAIARRQIVAELYVLPRGPWDAAGDPCVREEEFGFLVTKGVFARHVFSDGRRSAELLGEGDLLRPKQSESDVYASVDLSGRWEALTPMGLARLDDDLVAGLAGWPGLLPELAGRAVQRSRSLSLRLAIAQLPSLQRRLELLLWHLADRWGQRREGASSFRCD